MTFVPDRETLASYEQTFTPDEFAAMETYAIRMRAVASWFRHGYNTRPQLQRHWKTALDRLDKAEQKTPEFIEYVRAQHVVMNNWIANPPKKRRTFRIIS